MSRQTYLAMKCDLDRLAAEALIAGPPKPAVRFATGDLTPSQREAIEHRATIAEHEAMACKVPRPQDSVVHPPKPNPYT